MAGVNMSLDEIIKASKANKKGGRVGGRSEGAKKRDGARAKVASRNFAFTDRVPEGKWKHDMFSKVDVVGPRTGGGNPNKRVTLNVSNLDPQMIAAEDLEELFSTFEVEEIVLHHDANGDRIGTAAVTCKRSVANDIIAEYKNVRLDGRPLKLAIVDDENGSASIKNRLEFGNLSGRISKPIARQGGGIRKRGNGAAVGAPKQRKAFLDRMLDSDEETENAGRGGRFKKGGKGGARGKKEVKTTEDLDAELDKYMNSGKSSKMEA